MRVFPPPLSRHHAARTYAGVPQSNPLAPRFLANRHFHLSSAPTTPLFPFLAPTRIHTEGSGAGEGTWGVLCQLHKTFHLLRWTSGQRNKSCNWGKEAPAGSGRTAKVKMDNRFHCILEQIKKCMKLFCFSYIKFMCTHDMHILGQIRFTVLHAGFLIFCRIRCN